MRRAIGIVVTFATLAVIVGLRPAEHAEANHGCSAGERDVVIRTREAVIFTKGEIRASGVAKRYGCFIGKGSTYFLNGPQGDFGTAVPERPIALSGQFAAYVRNSASAAGGPTPIVTVRNLNDGRVAHESEGSARGGQGNPEDVVAALVAKRNGSVAWTTRASATGDPHTVQLIDATGQRRLLEESTGVDPGSLALSEDRTRIYWTSGGAPRVAALP